MKPLLNTLFVTTDGVYLSLDGENIVVLKDQPPWLDSPSIILSKSRLQLFGRQPGPHEEVCRYEHCPEFYVPSGAFSGAGHW